MKIYCKLLYVAMLGMLAGGCGAQPPANIQQADVEFTLKTAVDAGRMVFIGVGGDIDGLSNPDLIVQAGDTVRITIVNGDGIPHDFAIPDEGVQIPMLVNKDSSRDVVFFAGESARLAYFCSVSGHRQAGMEGNLIVQEKQAQSANLQP